MNELRRLLRHRQIIVGAAVVLFLVGITSLAPFLTSFDPSAQLDLATGQSQPPSWLHPFGTDIFSRDLLSRVLYGARISLVIAFLSILISVTVGTGVGLISGLSGSVVDTVLMRAVDAALAIPRVFLLLVVLALWERVDVVGLITILGFTSWFGTSRIVRAEVLSLRRRDFITAAQSLGIGKTRILLHHLLPNVVAPIGVISTLGIGQIILIEAGLSYLGVGVQEPTASLGRMMQGGSSMLQTAPWLSIFPGLIIVLTVIGFSLLADGLRNTMDPRAR
ncbi:MAG: ABC transporter permease [Gemmatimonadales bacterium]